MADIRAFHAMRYTKSAGEAKELTCPPYDIISEAERAAFLERNPHNVIRLELPRGEEPYKTAGKTLHTWLSDGTLRCDKDAGLYIYEEDFKTDVDHGEVRSLKGIVCIVRAGDFSAGVVLPPEETLAKAKKDRFELLKSSNCNSLSTYSFSHDAKRETQQLIDRLSADPTY